MGSGQSPAILLITGASNVRTLESLRQLPLERRRISRAQIHTRPIGPSLEDQCAVIKLDDKHRGRHCLKLGRPDATMDALDKSLTLVDPANLHNYAFGLLFRAEARIQQAEVTEASTIVADVARLTTGSTSQRIAQRITDVRALLAPWQRTKPVRELDERLAVYRPVMGSGSDNTKHTYSR
jgi:hypothetical protein